MAVSAMIRKQSNTPRQQDKMTRLHEPDLVLASSRALPDPRLIELARLLARRAAREWFEETRVCEVPRP